MDAAVNDVRVESRSADILANAIDDQQIDFVERQRRHKQFGFGQQLGFGSLHFLAWHNNDSRGVMELIFDDRNATEDRRVLDHHVCQPANDVFITKLGGPKVHGHGTCPLA